MANPAKRILRNGAIAGVTCCLIMFGWQVLTTDVPARKASPDACSLVRPELLISLIGKDEPRQETRGTKGVNNFATCSAGNRSARVSVTIVHYGRSGFGLPVSAAKERVRMGGDCRCEVVTTPKPIGDESYEFAEFEAGHVWVRMGATSIDARYFLLYGTVNGLFEGARAVAQEVAARCAQAC